MSTRIVLLWLAPWPAALALACAPAAVPPAAAPAPGAPAAPAAPAVGQPQYGGTFYLAQEEGPQTLDPQFTTGGGAVNALMRGIYEGLLEYRQADPFEEYRDYEPAPYLAERWQQPDPVTYVLSLRKGVKWHDGVEFTADDVVFTYERLRDPQNKFPERSRLAGVKTIEATDRYTVRITRESPSPEFLGILADNPRLALIAKHVGEQGGDYKTRAIGTGPFKVAEFDNKKGAVLAKHDAYWQEGRPYLNRFQLFFGLDKSGVAAALVAEKNDHYSFADKRQFEAIYATKKDLQYRKFVAEYNYGLRFNITRPPLDDVRVRRAVHLGIDRRALLETLTFGEGGYDQPGACAICPGRIDEKELLTLPGWRSPKEQDLADAKRLLAEAGLPNGFKTSALGYRTNSSHPQIIEAVSGQLRVVGIDLVPDLPDAATARKKYTEFDYDMSPVAGGVRPRPDADLFVLWYSKGSQNPGVKDPELDSLIERQSRELDVAARNKLLEQINRLLLDKMYIAPSVGGGYFMVWQPFVKNLYLGYSGQAWLRKPADVWIDQARMPADRPK